MSRQYNDPTGTVTGTVTASQIGAQFNDFYWQKKALIEVKKEQYFQQLADSTAMPKHMGKQIKRYIYVPLLDDANVNDQGIDAAGATIIDGNLYGSSKDIGTIQTKWPALSENGGRVNRVGFTRKEITGSLEKFGIFEEYTQESMDFDTDASLMEHINRTMVYGANELTEDMLQIDLIEAAGVVKYTGAAVSRATIDATPVTYRDLLRLHIDLNVNRSPLRTKMNTGTRLTDTVTTPGARPMYIGSELQPMLEEMVDLHGDRAFIPLQKYAAGSTVMTGEIGMIGYFRVIVVPEMLHYEGGGAALGGNTTHYSDGTNFNVFPMLVVGEESFTTIGFQTDGKTVKFKVFHKKPGLAVADYRDPYGETGFMSIKWYYGFMGLRTERLAVQFSSATM